MSYNYSSSVSPTEIWVIVGIVVAVWVVVAGGVSAYARHKGFPWFPIFLGAMWCWPLVLVLVALAGGKLDRTPKPHRPIYYGPADPSALDPTRNVEGVI